MTAYFDKDQVFQSLSKNEMMEFSGLDLMQKMISGALPASPISKTMNFRSCEAETGLVVFKGTPLMDHYNPAGTVHGGWVGTILDSAMGCAVHTMLEPGIGYSTVEFKVNLVRPLFAESGEVTCTGKVLHRGRTIATSEGAIHDANGKLIAHGTETCAIFPLRA